MAVLITACGDGKLRFGSEAVAGTAGTDCSDPAQAASLACQGESAVPSATLDQVGTSSADPVAADAPATDQLTATDQGTTVVLAPAPTPTPTPTPTSTPTPTPTPTVTPTPTPTPTSTPTPPPVGSCTVFPASSPWNADVSGYPVHAQSDAFIARMGADTAVHPDFGTTWAGAPNGIPYVLVSGDQPMVPINFVAYPEESDPGPYPIPLDAPIEGGPNGTGDRHVLAVDTTNCKLYELYRAFPTATGWSADNGAVFDLTKEPDRPLGWTSADAAGLPIFPGLVRYDEAAVSGKITHALRVTFSRSQRAIVLPARHYASTSTDTTLPPMGLRLRLKSSVDISSFSATNRAILQALKTYGMFVADNGGDWFISGAPDTRWSDNDLAQLATLHGRDFEVVDTGPIYTSYTQVP